MSVICQNFVQNAWKKDLCSNCFKSVGDHEIQNHEMNGGLKEKCESKPVKKRQVAQSSPKIYTTSVAKASVPHTTWKSLITEKNVKNSQPFKLENGFKGKLLTINKAANGMEKKYGDECNGKNGHASDTEVVTKKVIKCNSLDFCSDLSSNVSVHETVRNFNRKQLNGANVQNGKHEPVTNGHLDELKSQQTDNSSKQNGFKDVGIINAYTDSNSKQRKLQHVLSEEVSSPTRLQGILKKSVSFPTPNGRRGSNVGFKDEEPMVIGYGGRDFPAEDIDWEISPPSEGSDSLDEIDEDCEFSKMTQQNTEFNSDNANLSKNKMLVNKKEKSHCDENDPSKINAIKAQSMQMMSNKNIKNSDKYSQESSLHLLNGHKKCEKMNSNHESNNKQNCINFSNGSKTEIQLCSKDSSKENCKLSNITTESEEQCFKVGGKIKTTSETDQARVGAKNSQENGNCVQYNSERQSQQSPRHSLVISDGKEATLRNMEENEWEEREKCSTVQPNQILQAINTSLANRHKINSAHEYDENNCSENVQESNSSNESETDQSYNPDKNAIAKSNALNIEPRSSFLHGVTPNKSKPSAIYGPASDLFVYGSDSSPSTSSEEINKVSCPMPSVNAILVNGRTNQPKLDGNHIVPENSESNLKAIINISNNGKPKIGKEKPSLPAKPVNPYTKKIYYSNDDLAPKSLDSALLVQRRKSEENLLQNNSRFSTKNISIHHEGPRSIALVDHYAESNIYHEVDDEDSCQEIEPRESKLAALAMELEQARQPNTKRQAPAPPKIPNPPTENLSNCISTNDIQTLKGKAISASSSSSAASTSSQDTENGYTSWNMQCSSDTDNPDRKQKSKSSFLLAQYSKAKGMLDSGRNKKRFSIKKLLKIKKEEDSMDFDSECPNPKAWKYSDHFDRPRAKLDIIHPMDLEKKSVTVNPGFESMSMSSFTTSADDQSHRSSICSEYGSYYSDTITVGQDSKSEAAYECIQSQTSGDEDLDGNGRKSPTPSRTSVISRASTLTSGSSKNSDKSNRPPKPPPPPRAHSLVPGNKSIDSTGTHKVPVGKCNSLDSVNSTDAVQLPAKPEVPKRHVKLAAQLSESGIYGNTIASGASTESLLSNEEDSLKTVKASEHSESEHDEDQQSSEESETENVLMNGDEHLSSNQPDLQPSKESQVSILKVKSDSQTFNITVKSTMPAPSSCENTTSSKLVTKAPSKPPPIYVKSQLNIIPKNLKPWKTLEDSYLALSTTNRDILGKLVNQASKKKREMFAKLRSMQFQWSDFEVDVDQPSSIFAFGEKIAFHATIPQHSNLAVTLLIIVQQCQSRLNNLKYPVFGQFVDHVPGEFLENTSDDEFQSMPATFLVLDRCNVSTIECFSESLPPRLTTDNEKELCFVMLQLIQTLKSFQAQGVESLDSSFQNLILTRTKHDKYHTLVLLSDNCYEDADYLSESCKISLCQYALFLLFQMLGIQSVEEFGDISLSKFSSETPLKVLETSITLLSEEKAGSLSLTKTLLESFFWGMFEALNDMDDSDDLDNILQRWLDVKKADFIKHLVNDDGVCDITVQDDCLSQFLIRTSVRNIKEVLLYL